MIIDGAWENKIRDLWMAEKYSIVKTEILYYRIRYYEKLSRVEDKFLIDYRMAYLEYMEKNFDLANYYLRELEYIFSDEYNRKSMEYDYYRYRWLKINNNFDKISNKEKIKEMIEVYNYYKSMDMTDLANTALENISKINGNEEEMLNNLKNLLLSKKITDYILIKSILNDCDKINHSLYIKALDIVNKYTINIDVV